MTSRILVGYATRYGSTRDVAEAVAQAMREEALEAVAQPVREVRRLGSYAAVVVGAPLWMFRWHREALAFLTRNRAALANVPVALFALGPTHDPHDEQEWLDSRAQFDRALAGVPWLEPAAIRVFGGRYDPAALRFPLTLLAGHAPATDLRDWPGIRTWSRELAATFGSSGA